MTFWNDRKSNGVVSFPRQKGRTDTLPAEAQSPAIPGPMPVTRTVDNLASDSCAAKKSPFRAGHLPFYAIAIFLVLLGFGEKLKHYEANPDPASRNLVIKYWVDQQTDLKHAHVKVRVLPRSWVDQSIHVQPQSAAGTARIEGAVEQQSTPLRLEKVLPLLPLRSPPSISFLA